MGFRNPITSADQVVDGTFTGTYTLSGSLTVDDGTLVDSTGHPLPHWAGSNAQVTIDARGAVAAVVDANNGITIAHDCGRPPIYAEVIGNDSTYDARWRRDLSDANNVVFRPLNTSAGVNVPAGTNVTVSLIAIG